MYIDQSKTCVELNVNKVILLVGVPSTVTTMGGLNLSIKTHCSIWSNQHIEFLFVYYIFRPTFKTATPTSRTQLRQQLQREHLQELERREAEKRQQLIEQSTNKVEHNAPVKVPLHVDVVDVPPQVLQVGCHF